MPSTADPKTSTRPALERLVEAVVTGELNKKTYAHHRKVIVGSIHSAESLRDALRGIEFDSVPAAFVALEALLDTVVLTRTRNDSARAVLAVHPIGRLLVSVLSGVQVSQPKWDVQVDARLRRKNWPLTDDELESSSRYVLRSFVSLRLPSLEEVANADFEGEQVLSSVHIEQLAELGCPLARELHSRIVVLQAIAGKEPRAKDSRALKALVKAASTYSQPKQAGGMTSQHRAELSAFRRDILNCTLQSQSSRRLVASALFAHLLKAKTPSQNIADWVFALERAWPKKASAAQLTALNRQSPEAVLGLLESPPKVGSESERAALLQGLSARELSASAQLALQAHVARTGVRVADGERASAAAAALELLHGADGDIAVRVWRELEQAAEKRELVHVASRVIEILEEQRRSTQESTRLAETRRLRAILSGLRSSLRTIARPPAPWFAIDAEKLTESIEQLVNSSQLQLSPRTRELAVETTVLASTIDFQTLVQQLSRAAVIGGSERRQTEFAILEQLALELDSRPQLVEQCAEDSSEFYEVLSSFVVTNPHSEGQRVVERVATGDDARMAIWRHVAMRDARNAAAPFALPEALAAPVVEEVGSRIASHIAREGVSSEDWATNQFRHATSIVIEESQQEVELAQEMLRSIAHALDEAKENVARGRN